MLTIIQNGNIQKIQVEVYKTFVWFGLVKILPRLCKPQNKKLKMFIVCMNVPMYIGWETSFKNTSKTL